MYLCSHACFGVRERAKTKGKTILKFFTDLIPIAKIIILRSCRMQRDFTYVLTSNEYNFLQKRVDLSQHTSSKKSVAGT